VESDGAISDVRYNGPAYKAGLAPGMKITAVDGHQFAVDVLKDSIDEAKSSSAPIALIVANGIDVHPYQIDYHDGLRYPHLERNNDAPDYLGEIYQPLSQ
jgi:predicted metalloprotease with PDZ domain